MKTLSSHRTWWNRLGNLLFPIVIALIFLLFTFAYYPFRERFQFDTDEGLNLMRSMLVTLEHPLYSEVSSDQPPLFTHLLAILFRFVGFEVNPARLLVLLFATLLVWSGAQYLQLTWGKLAAILFLPLVVMAPEYLTLSVSVMIGVPSIALAAVSLLFITLWHQQRQRLWLALSGLALGLSVLTKLFTGSLALIFLIGLAASEYFREREAGLAWKMLRPALLWGSCFAGVTILLGLIMIGPENVPLIVLPHAAAPTTEWLQGPGYDINTRLQAAVPLLFLAGLGALVAIYKRNWLSLYPLAWSLLAYMLFSFYSPVFYHHQLLVTIPAILLAAAAVGEGILSLLRLRHFSTFLRLETLWSVGVVLSFVLISLHYQPVLDQELRNKPRFSNFALKASPARLRVLRTMDQYVAQTNWIMTDVPMYAFRVRRPVPPSLATFSSKRLATGSLTDEDILEAMRTYRPEQVLIARFEIPALEAYVQENYTLILSAEYSRLFLRKDLEPIIE